MDITNATAHAAAQAKRKAEIAEEARQSAFERVYSAIAEYVKTQLAATIDSGETRVYAAGPSPDVNGKTFEVNADDFAIFVEDGGADALREGIEAKGYTIECINIDQSDLGKLIEVAFTWEAATANEEDGENASDDSSGASSDDAKAA